MPDVERFEGPGYQGLRHETPESWPVHASAVLTGEAQASLRRGLDLRLGAELENTLTGRYAGALLATLDAGGHARAGFSLQARMPLDLFGEAGLLAIIRARAEAAAYISTGLGLNTAEAFVQLLESEPAIKGPVLEMARVALEETEVTVNAWAHAGVALQIAGEFGLTGTLLPGAVGGPGFTYFLHWGIGWGYNAGWSIRANVGIPDPQRLMRRLGDRAAELVMAEATEHAASLPDARRDVAERAIPLAGAALRLSMRTLFDLGLRLARATSATARKDAASAVWDGFLEEARLLVLDAAVEAAMTEVQEVLGDIAASYLQNEGVTPERLIAALRSLRDAIAPAVDAEVGSPEWLAAVVTIAHAVEGMIDAGPGVDLPESLREAVLGAARVAAAGGMLTLRATEQRAARGPHDTWAPPAAGPPLDDDLRGLLKISGAGDAWAELVRFVLDSGILSSVARVAPPTASALEWLCSAVDADDLTALLTVVLDDRALPADDIQRLTDAVAAALVAAIRDHVQPLFDPLRADPITGRFIDQVVMPLLTSLPEVVVPALRRLDSGTAILRLREAISAVLLQSLTDYMAGTSDALTGQALQWGSRELAGIAQRIREKGEDDEVFEDVTALGSFGLLGFMLVPDDVAELVRLHGELLARIDHYRQDLMQPLWACLRLGLSNPDTRRKVMSTLTGSDAAPVPDLQEQVYDAVLATFALAGDVLERLVGLVGEHFVNVGKYYLKKIEDAGRAVVEAVENAIAWFSKNLEYLRREVEKLLDAIEDAADKIAKLLEDAADGLAALHDGLIAKVKDYGWSLVDPLVPDWPGFAAKAIREAYNAAFDVGAWVLDAPFEILKDVTRWISDGLVTQLNGAAVDPQALLNSIRSRILAAPSLQQIDIPISVSTFLFSWHTTISIPAGFVGKAIAEAVLGVLDSTGVVDACAEQSIIIQKAEAQRGTAQAAIDRNTNELAANAQFGTLTPALPLDVIIDKPANYADCGTQTSVVIKVMGANRTFVDTPFGIPRRVSVRLNDREVPYETSQWTEIKRMTLDGFPRTVGMQLTLQLRLPEPAAPAERQAAREAIAAAVPSRRADVSFDLAVRRADGAQGRVVQVRERIGRDELRVRKAVRAEMFTTPRIPPRVVEASLGVHQDDTLLAETYGTISANPHGSPAARALAAALDAPAPTTVFMPGDPRQSLPATLGLNVLQVAVTNASPGAPKSAVKHVVFVMAPPRPLVSPVPVSPPDGVRLSGYPRTTTLQWQAVPGASGYEVAYAWQSGGQWSAGDVWIPVAGTSFTFDFVGAQPGRWRVRAVDATGARTTSEPSPWRGFDYS